MDLPGRQNTAVPSCILILCTRNQRGRQHQFATPHTTSSHRIPHDVVVAILEGWDGWVGCHTMLSTLQNSRSRNGYMPSLPALAGEQVAGEAIMQRGQTIHSHSLNCTARPPRPSPTPSFMEPHSPPLCCPLSLTESLSVAEWVERPQVLKLSLLDPTTDANYSNNLTHSIHCLHRLMQHKQSTSFNA